LDEASIVPISGPPASEVQIGTQGKGLGSRIRHEDIVIIVGANVPNTIFANNVFANDGKISDKGFLNEELLHGK